MRDQLGNFGRLHPVVERKVEIPGKLNCLIARHERSQRDDTPVPLRQTRTIPDIAQQALFRVLAECWGDGLKRALHCASLSKEWSTWCEKRRSKKEHRHRCFHKADFPWFGVAGDV